MDPLQSLHITDLLRKREAEFVRIWECERAVQAIVRGAYVFEAPDLPSRRKPQRKRKATPKTTTHLRRLRRDREHAYRVQYEHEGETRTGLTTDTEFLRSLLALDPPGFRVCRIESVRLGDTGETAPVSTLWKRPAGESRL
jgi:hypothetical protein